MKILLFGISNVGKTTVGELLAARLGYNFYDLDEEVKKEYQMTLEEFVHTGNLKWRDQKRGRIIKKILNREEDMVFAITPISYIENFKKRIFEEDIFAIELTDTPENIFDRLIFSDENDRSYKDDDYKNAHKDYYLSEIAKDLEWYGPIFYELGIENRIDMRNESQEQLVERIMNELPAELL